MFNFPFFRFPYSNYYYPYYNNYLKNNQKNFYINKQETNNKNDRSTYSEKKKKKKSYKYNSFGPVSFINPFAEPFDENEPVLEILGLKLYLDDLIILGLLFLLYKEEVQDEMLFLALILLLLS